MVYSLIVFVKNPIAGKVKTRVAATVGHEKAVEVYLDLLSHTKKTVQAWFDALLESPQSAQLQVRVNVYYGDFINDFDLWNDSPFQKKMQTEGDLGERMRDAFVRELAEGAERVVIIGSDCLELRPLHLQAAFEALDAHEIVLGPATDGGYYLLGMKQLHPSLFENKSWSQPTLLSETLTDLTGTSHTLLETLSDVDTWEDYVQAKSLLGHLG
jgi:uncharacterized protein